MDRTEYKERLDEAGSLIALGDKEAALDLLDGMNWRKVHNVNLLLKAGEYYETLDCPENALDLLEAAHERSPIGRMIIYRLALISIRLGRLDEAREYYNEFVEIAPHDSLKYVIKYRLNEAKGADETTLIAILEELRSHDLIEEWLFELACLYRKTSQVDRCIEICDEIILWFGEGPYVEKALEMKLLYHPLDKQQEDKYREFQQKRDGLTEIRPDENYGGSEIINRPITIPEIEEEPEQFDTVNLQKAIRRNIEEIMQATEAGEISENMEAIKGLVEEIPYLQVAESEKSFDETRRQQRKEDMELGEQLRSRFDAYLSEEYDGQMSMYVPEDMLDREPPIEGQVTIEDVIERWERTKRAAEAALQDAEQQRFEQVKAKALAEANQIMDRLNDAIPRLDAGATPAELMKEEILGREGADGGTYKDGVDGGVAAFGSEPSAAKQASSDTSPTTPLDASVDSVSDLSSGSVSVSLGSQGSPRATISRSRAETENTPNANTPVQSDVGGVAGGEASEARVEAADGETKKTFTIPKVAAEGEAIGVGLEIPVISAAEKATEGVAAVAVAAAAAGAEPEVLTEAEVARKTSEWMPPSLDAQPVEAGAENTTSSDAAVTDGGAGGGVAAFGSEPSDAKQASSDSSALRADTVTENAPIATSTDSTPVTEPADSVAAQQADGGTDRTEEKVGETAQSDASVARQAADAPAEAANAELPTVAAIEAQAAQKKNENAAVNARQPKSDDASINETNSNVTATTQSREQDIAASSKQSDSAIASEQPRKREVDASADAFPAAKEAQLGAEAASAIATSAVDNAASASAPASTDGAKTSAETAATGTDTSVDSAPASAPTELSDEEREIFSYFTPIKGMEDKLLETLNAERARHEGLSKTSGGHIIIQGGKGSGKTTLATSIVKVLQNEGMVASRAVGKIDGTKLNEKNIRELFDKIRSGALIVENAGNITRDTAVTLSLLLDSDTSGILLILEDSRLGIDRALSLNGNFSSKFSERIIIPLLSIDELVNFGRTYATDMGYTIDETAVLALYDRINIIQRLDHPTYLTEVKEIIDQAIDRAEHRKGFLGIGGKKYDEEGNLILREKDFNE